jgi:hypothetical protein
MRDGEADINSMFQFERPIRVCLVLNFETGEESYLRRGCRGESTPTQSVPRFQPCHKSRSDITSLSLRIGDSQPLPNFNDESSTTRGAESHNSFVVLLGWCQRLLQVRFTFIATKVLEVKRVLKRRGEEHGILHS